LAQLVVAVLALGRHNLGVRQVVALDVLDGFSSADWLLSSHLTQLVYLHGRDEVLFFKLVGLEETFVADVLLNLLFG